MKDTSLNIKLSSSEKNIIIKQAQKEGKNITNFVLSKILLDNNNSNSINTQPVKNHPIQLEADSRALSFKTTTQGLFYGIFKKLDSFKSRSCLGIPKKLASRLQLAEGDFIFLSYDSATKSLLLNTESFLEYEYKCKIHQGSKSLTILLPEDLSRELDLFPGTPIMLYYFSKNNYFNCKKAISLLPGVC